MPDNNRSLASSSTWQQDAVSSPNSDRKYLQVTSQVTSWLPCTGGALAHPLAAASRLSLIERHEQRPDAASHLEPLRAYPHCRGCHCSRHGSYRPYYPLAGAAEQAGRHHPALLKGESNQVYLNFIRKVGFSLLSFVLWLCVFCSKGRPESAR
jgi:hypothetical protein